MTKIGIFGDSWGSIHLNVKNRYLGWPEILEKTYNYKVTNYSFVGSSMFYSYKKFLENHSSNNYNIFLVTEPNRIYANKLKYYNLREHYSASVVESMLGMLDRSDIQLSNNQKQIIESINLYFKVWANDEYQILMQELMLKHLKSISNNTIFIPCFKNSFMTQPEFSLIDFCHYELDTLKFNEKYSGLGHWSVVDNKVLIDTRVCHMNEQNNIMFANKINDAISSNNLDIKFVHEDFVVEANGLDAIMVWKDYPLNE